MSQRTRSRTADAAANAPEPQATARTRTRAGKRIAPEAAPELIADAGSPASLAAPTLAPDALARALRAVAAELERDPALAQRVTDAMAGPSTLSAAPATTSAGGYDTPPDEGADDEGADDEATSPLAADTTGKPTTSRAFRPRLVTGAPPELGPGIPDPFALRKRLGKDGLRAALAELRLGSLRAIVREHRLDPGGKVGKLNDPEKLRALILAATN